MRHAQGSGLATLAARVHCQGGVTPPWVSGGASWGLPSKSAGGALITPCDASLGSLNVGKRISAARAASATGANVGIEAPCDQNANPL